MGVRPLHVTVIGATTGAGVLPETLIERFGVKPVLTRLTPNEACILALNMVERLFQPPLKVPPVKELALFAHAADSNPRRIRQLLEYAVDQHYDPDGYSMEKVLARARMTWDGLDWAQQRYLVLLWQSVGPMGKTQIKTLLREPSIHYIERRLYDRSLILFTKG